MIVTTRFCPSTNGPLHLGHVTTLFANEYFAHSVGGKFFVRFDDISYSSRKSGRYKEVMEWQKIDIEWLGIQVDEWQKDSDYEMKALEALSYEKFPLLDEDETAGYDLCQSVRLGTSFIMYPFAPRQTAVRAVIDYSLDVTHLIRGDDFLTEFSYYHFVCNWMKYPMPKYICLPRLESSRGDISKTNGGFTLAEFRNNGYSPQDIRSMLEKACLVNPPNGWDIFNWKRNPVLVV